MTAPFGGSTAVGGGEVQALRRTMSFGDFVAYALVFMVPIAIFGLFGPVFAASGGAVALVYAVGAGVMMLTASSFSLMIQAFPKAGSVQAYASRVLSPWAGFLSGWTVLLDYLLVPALLSLVAAAGAASVVPSVSAPAWLAIFILVNTAINLTGMKSTVIAIRFFLAAELIVLVVNVTAGSIALSQGAGRGWSWEPMLSSDLFKLGLGVTVSTVLGGAAVAATNFLGFDALAPMTEDAKGGPRQVGRAMLVGLGLIGVLFICQAWIAALLVPDPAVLIGTGDPAGTAFYETARVAAGPVLATLTATATALAWGLANNMVAQVATSRLLWAMAREGQMPRWLATISVSRRVPTNATVAIGLLSLVLGFTFALRDNGIALLSSLVNFGGLTSFLIVNVCVIVHRIRGGHLEGGWVRVWVVPPVAILSLVAIIWHANVYAQALGFAWLAVGVVILLVMVARGRTPRLANPDEASAVGSAPVVTATGVGRRA